MRDISDLEFEIGQLRAEIAELRVKINTTGGDLPDDSGIPFVPRKVTVDLRGVVYGPFKKGDGRYVVVNVATNVLSQSNVRPQDIPEHEVWIDLKETYGRVYIPRLG